MAGDKRQSNESADKTNPVVSEEDRTQFLLDGEDNRGDDTTMASADTPPEPLTVDFHPKAPASQASSSDEPLLTMTDLTEVGIGSKPGVSIGPAPAAVRHSVPGYEILKELGRGGMGVVYQAKQKGLNRLVALKMILSGSHAGAAELERFRREAESVAALQHPHIVQIFEIGEVEGRPYLAFEYIEGGSLAQQLGGNPWPTRAAAALVEMLARAVQFAHDRGIVHRDLKPGNILLAGDGARKDEKPKTPSAESQVRLTPPTPKPEAWSPKITDFGLAKKFDKDSDWSATGEFIEAARQTRTGAVMGTPSYIAPEQAAGKNRDVGPGADIYALGAILYELLTGRPPFRGETPLDTVLQVMSDDPVPVRRLQSKAPRDLETICMKCLQKQPGKRYASAGDLAEDLRRFQHNEPIAARPVGSWERFVKWAKRRPAAAISVLASIVVVAAMLGVSVYYNVELRLAAERVQNEAENARESERLKANALYDAEQQKIFAQQQMNIAKGEKKTADERLKEVEKARADFERAHKEALRREQEARRAAYALALSRASNLVERDPQRAARLLDSSLNCPIELRDFTWHHLRELCRIEDQFLSGHLNTITQVVWSPDGALLASASWDGTIRVWDVRHQQTAVVLQGHRGMLRAVAFAPDGRTLVSVDNLHLLFWDLPPAILPAPKGAPRAIKPWARIPVDGIQALAIEPDGKMLAIAGNDGSIRFWRIPTLPRGELMSLVGGAASFLGRLPEGDKKLPFGPGWPIVGKPAETSKINGSKEQITALAWTHEGLYAAGFDRTVRFWSKPNASSVEVCKHPSKILSLAVASDDSLLAIGGDSAEEAPILIWNLKQKREALRLRGHTRAVHSLAFDSDGKFLASASQDATVRLWELPAGHERSVYRGHKDSILTVAFAPDESTLASAGMDHMVRLWLPFGRREETLAMELPRPLAAGAVSADARTLAVAKRDGSIQVWQREAGREAVAYVQSHSLKGVTGAIAALAMAPDGRTVAAIVEGQQNQWSVAVWNLPAAGKAPVEISNPRIWKSQVKMNGLALHGNYLATVSDGGLQVWDLPQRKLHFEHRAMRGKPLSVAFTPDGKYLLAAGGLYVNAWDMSNGREAASLMFAHRNLVVSHVCVGPPQEDFERKKDVRNCWTVVTADVTGGAKIWDLEPNQPKPDSKSSPNDPRLRFRERATLPGHAEPIMGVSFAPDQQTIATCGEDRSIRLWDPITGQERASLFGHTDAVFFGAFVPDGSALLSVGREGTIKVWHAPR